MKKFVLTVRRAGTLSSLTSRAASLVVVSLFALSASGCGAIKNSLKPWVCDCDAELACADGSVPRVVEIAPEEGPEVDEEATQPDPGDDIDETQEEKESTLVASSFQVPEARHTIDDEKRANLRRDYSLRAELDDTELVFTGKFSSSPSADALVVSASGQLTMAFGGGGKTTLEDFTGLSEESYVSQLTEPVVAARLVDDGRLELIAQELVEPESEDDTPYVRLSIYKVFGREMARVFEIPIAERLQDGEWKKLREIRFLNGVRARWIEVIDLGENPTPEIYRWNRWEGMFRVPAPVPTAPGRSPVRDIEPDDTSSAPVSLWNLPPELG